MSRLLEKYNNEIIDNLKKEFGYKNPMEVPRIYKVVLNVGIGEAMKNSKLLDEVVENLTIISGQKPVVQKAKKSIASFKLRQGMKIGASVTLRKDKMWAFMDKLIAVALPRIRDFRGISHKAFDGRGNYTLGLREQLVFPEIDYDKVEKIHGMDIIICTSTKSDEEARKLLEEFGMPYRR